MYYQVLAEALAGISQQNDALASVSRGISKHSISQNVLVSVSMGIIKYSISQNALVSVSMGISQHSISQQNSLASVNMVKNQACRQAG